MRIVIEADRDRPISVREQDGAIEEELPEAIDGGGPPDHLLEMLGVHEAVKPEEAKEDSEFEPIASGASDDAGAAPIWLVDVIEGSGGAPPEISGDAV